MKDDPLTRPRPPTARDLLYIRTPQLWTHWPFLPLVRRPKDGEIELGVLVDLFGALNLPGYGSTVFITNLFLLPRRLEDLLALPKEAFDTAEEVVRAGWVVD